MNILFGTMSLKKPAGLEEQMSKRTSVETESEPIKLRKTAPPSFVTQIWKAEVYERSIEGCVVRDYNVSFSEQRRYALVVKSAAGEVCISKTSEQSQSGRHGPLRIFPPRTRTFHLDNPACEIDAQSFDRNFH